MLALALSMMMTMSGPSQAGPFHHGVWEGRCHRAGNLDGMDHELCTASFWRADNGPGAEIARSAEGLTIEAWPGKCQNDVPPSRVPQSMLTGRKRAAIVAASVRSHIETVLRACNSSLKTPPIRESDIAAILRDSDGLKPGSFLLRKPADRAPFTARCSQNLEKEWRAGLAASPVPADGNVKLMMYTMSKEGFDLAEARFEAAPDMMEDFYGLGLGPGGTAMVADKPVAAWRNAPSEWFTRICDIAVESWSSFVELALFRSGNPGTLVFTSRVGTGVAAMSGYAITQTPPPGFPDAEK